ncbi:MAG: iron-containing alcohol dehydrogenase [Lachnospiraceae bacterium]|nr:iron-containing alcohol dehydrogenase [Lachnospiraceae bacterium]
MNIFKKIYCRCFQTAFRIALPVLPYRNPEVREHISEIPEILKKEAVVKPLIITDQTLSSIGAVDGLQKSLTQSGTDYALFDGAFPNPTTALARQASAYYRKNQCDGLIAFGGGSPMDLAKAVGVMLARPDKPLEKLAGILKVHRKLPVLIAIPTTAGTGSETTLAAVLIDADTRHKFTINDFPLIPKYAVLDPSTIHTLPVSIAASTGLDALTHAVEAYIGRSTTRQTRADAETAVKLIFENFDTAVRHETVTAERAMLKASHYAGRAFTRSYVGYIHAVSHSLSGQYDLPHGWTNAVLLPLVLKRYGSAVWKKLAKLAVCAGLGTPEEGDNILAERFISAIEEKNRLYDIPCHIDAVRKEDIPLLASHADKEANPLYPVPVLWDAKELEVIYQEVCC